LVNTLFRPAKKEVLAKYPEGSALSFYFLLFSLWSDENGTIKMAGFQNKEACLRYYICLLDYFQFSIAF
jgi:hypothetical protein